MTEIEVKQRSEEWRELRQCVCLTASQFGDACGMGRGKASDFLAHIVQSNGENSEENDFTKHGVLTEPIIFEAYQLLSGHIVEESGFWIPEKGNPMFNLIGATPDAKVMQNTPKGLNCIGLAEFKAPVYQLTSKDADPRTGISRQYMAQMQGQMAICKKPWCDYMAVCMKTREVMLKRVSFSPMYWRALSARLRMFAECLQECRRLKERSQLHTIVWSEKLPRFTPTLVEEKDIVVTNLLERNSAGDYRCRTNRRKMWMPFEFLVGVPVNSDNATSRKT